jgi:hypothetical protein
LRLVGKLGRLMVGFPVDSKAHWEILTPDAIAHARIQGTFGVLSQSSGADSDGLAATAREKRIVVAGLDIGIPAPDEVTNDKDGWGLVGFDGRAAVMCRSKDSSSAGDGVSRMYVWGAGTDGWKTFSVPGSLPRVKMIDSWIMGLASSREPNAARPMAGGGQRSRRESPGASSRRQLEQIPADKEADRGAPAGRVATDVLFRHSDAYYPGILF